MPKEINLGIFPDYEEVFNDGNENEQLSFFLRDIPTFNLVRSMSFISACLDTGIENFETQYFILKELLKPLDRKEQIEISDKINSLTGGSMKIVFHQVACLLITQTSVLNFNSGVDKTLSRENARNILKAFFWCNSKYSKGMSQLIPSLENEKNREKICGLFMVMDIAQLSFFNKQKDILEQSFKLKLFDEFLRTDNAIGKYYYKFIKSKNVSNLLEIIKITWNIYFKILQPKDTFKADKIINIINVTNNQKEVLEYFNSISILQGELEHYSKKFSIDDLDFKLIREKPLYKLNENHFIVLNSNFFVDKLFNSLLFDYFNFICSLGYTGSFGDFKSYYALIFVEKYLLQNILGVIFAKTNANIKQEGDKLKQHDKFNKDYSDYYLRIGNKLVLFECKDTIMKSDIKYSYDYKKVIDEVNKKFITKVGVDQIIKVISSVSKNQIPFDNMNEDDLKKLTIIPAIVYTDLSFSARAVNYYVNTIFRDILTKHRFLFMVEPIVMIHIDSLINYKELFRDKVNFINTLEKYNRFILKKEKKMINTSISETNCLIDYNSFLKKYIHKERGFTHKDINVYRNMYQELYHESIDNVNS